MAGELMGVYEPMTEREYMQRYHLPSQLQRARAKVARLENRARLFGMNELLTNLQHADEAWDRAVWGAQDAAEALGGSIGFGETRR